MADLDIDQQQSTASTAPKRTDSVDREHDATVPVAKVERNETPAVQAKQTEPEMDADQYRLVLDVQEQRREDPAVESFANRKADLGGNIFAAYTSSGPSKGWSFSNKTTVTEEQAGPATKLAKPEGYTPKDETLAEIRAVQRGELPAEQVNREVLAERLTEHASRAESAADQVRLRAARSALTAEQGREDQFRSASHIIAGLDQGGEPKTDQTLARGLAKAMEDSRDQTDFEASAAARGITIQTSVDAETNKKTVSVGWTKDVGEKPLRPYDEVLKAEYGPKDAERASLPAAEAAWKRNERALSPEDRFALGTKSSQAPDLEIDQSRMSAAGREAYALRTAQSRTQAHESSNDQVAANKAMGEWTSAHVADARAKQIDRPGGPDEQSFVADLAQRGIEAKKSYNPETKQEEFSYTAKSQSGKAYSYSEKQVGLDPEKGIAPMGTLIEAAAADRQAASVKRAMSAAFERAGGDEQKAWKNLQTELAKDGQQLVAVRAEGVGKDGNGRQVQAVQWGVQDKASGKFQSFKQIAGQDVTTETTRDGRAPQWEKAESHDQSLKQGFMDFSANVKEGWKTFANDLLPGSAHKQHNTEAKPTQTRTVAQRAAPSWEREKQPEATQSRGMSR